MEARDAKTDERFFLIIAHVTNSISNSDQGQTASISDDRGSTDKATSSFEDERKQSQSSNVTIH
uniref:Uncharacterized protein n=1 Tax=Oryza punctata TaxID=4537 RepID=A0A0E0L808_ORYPU